MTEFLTLLALAALYFLPTIIAMMNKAKYVPGIFIINLFLGWTVLGWIGALVWAVSSPPLDQEVVKRKKKREEKEMVITKEEGKEA